MFPRCFDFFSKNRSKLFLLQFSLHYLRSQKNISDMGVSVEQILKEKFEEAFREYFTSLFGYAMSFVKDEDAAKDIVHDVFFSLWNKRKNIDFSHSLQPYLISLTRNRSLNYLKYLKIRNRHKTEEIKTGEIYASLPDHEQEELIDRIMHRIADLPERCRDVMWLYLVECKKYKEIAEQLNISVYTVKDHISHGLQVLRADFPVSLLLLCFSVLKKNKFSPPPF